MFLSYNLFISHSWDYAQQYNTLISWLDASSLYYKNYSISIEKSFDDMSNRKLKEKLTEQIRHASVVIIIGGMYAAYSDWIDYEIDEAVRMGKKIIGIYPWGQDRMPTKIQQHADKIIRWQSDSLIQAIRELG